MATIDDIAAIHCPSSSPSRHSWVILATIDDIATVDAATMVHPRHHANHSACGTTDVASIHCVSIMIINLGWATYIHNDPQGG